MWRGCGSRPPFVVTVQRLATFIGRTVGQLRSSDTLALVARNPSGQRRSCGRKGGLHKATRHRPFSSMAFRPLKFALSTHRDGRDNLDSSVDSTVTSSHSNQFQSSISLTPDQSVKVIVRARAPTSRTSKAALSLPAGRYLRHLRLRSETAISSDDRQDKGFHR